MCRDMNADNRYVRFDWAVKRMLRNLINNKKTTVQWDS